MLPKGYTHSYTLTSKTNVDLLFDKTLKTGEFLLFNCCKLLCSSRVLRVANLQKPKMGSKRSVPSRHRSLTTYEFMFAVLVVILVALCAGLIAVSWLSIQGSVKGKLHKVILSIFNKHLFLIYPIAPAITINSKN